MSRWRRWLVVLCLIAGVGVPGAGWAEDRIVVRIDEVGKCGTSTVAGLVDDIIALAFSQRVNRHVSERSGLPTDGPRWP